MREVNINKITHTHTSNSNYESTTPFFSSLFAVWFEVVEHHGLTVDAPLAPHDHSHHCALLHEHWASSLHIGLPPSTLGTSSSPSCLKCMRSSSCSLKSTKRATSPNYLPHKCLLRCQGLLCHPTDWVEHARERVLLESVVPLYPVDVAFLPHLHDGFLPN